MDIILSEIGTVYSSRKDIFDDNWDLEDSYIELSHSFSEQSLFGLEDFSHVEIIFYMDKVKTEKIIKDARHPRNREDWPKVGIFSQRGKNRPNQLGLTISRIKKVDGNKLYLEGFDAIDGTKVLDIKPWVKEFAPRGKQKQPSWISELMANYWE